MPKGSEKEILYQEIIMNFINAPTLIQATEVIFSGIKTIFNFSDSFPEKAKLNFSVRKLVKKINLDDLEKNLFCLLMREFFSLKLLDNHIGKIQDSHGILTYDREKQRVILIVTQYSQFELHYFPPDLIMESDESRKWQTFKEIESRILFRPLNRINKIKKISEMVLETKKGVSKTRSIEIEQNFIKYWATLMGYKTISLVRRDLKNLLNELVEGTNLCDTSKIHELIDYYNDEKYKYDDFKRMDVGKNDIISESFQIEEGCFLPIHGERIVGFRDYWGLKYKYFIIHFTIESLKSKQFKDRLRNCQRCAKYFIATKDDKRIKYCPDCSRKSKMSKEARRKYMQDYRKKERQKRQEKLAPERELMINSYIKSGFSRKEAIELIEDES